jgi:60 kDa SS-A/Ro ribonucleoprotein
MGPKGNNMSNAIKNLASANRTARTVTPQNQRTLGRTDEVKNNAGGFTFKVSDKDRLERFLILGTDGGTFYVNENKLTKQNAKVVSDLIASNERLVIDTLVDIATTNRAAKNSPSLYALALVLAEGKDKDYLRATDVVNKVVRTGTHLFEFCNYIDSLGGWGRAKRSAVAGWYEGKTADQIAYQAVKYRQREGWTHRDVFRKVHPVGVDQKVGNFILDKSEGVVDDENTRILTGFTWMQSAKSVDEVVRILNEYKNLPWETIPTQFLTDEKVWKTLFYNGALGQTALLRNVTRFAKLGAFDDLVFAGDVANALADADRIAKGRVHPVAYANALGIYRKGTPSRPDRYGYSYGYSKDWTNNAKIAGALEAGFYESFGTIEPANKATMVALDVSGSMAGPSPAGLVGLNCREASAVMAMVTVRTEPYTMVTAFTGGGWYGRASSGEALSVLDISDRDSLETVVNKISGLNFGSTDCAQPMLYAKAKNLGIDTFAVYTDNETWAGSIKPFQALKQYRQSSGRDARLAVVGMAATDFTIADPSDSGMMDFVGFDSSAPSVLADFSAGRI